jgi:hypothetical protein
MPLELTTTFLTSMFNELLSPPEPLGQVID